MSAPEPVTPASRDYGRRAQSVYDLEETLVAFLKRIFSAYRYDNPTVNLAQASEPAHPIEIVRDPDQPPVSYDYTERAQTLFLKVPPRIERGSVPKTVTGEIAVDKLPDHPSITVQGIAAKVQTIDSHNEKIVTVRIFVHTYDESPELTGDEDVQNMLEAIEIAFVSFGSQGIDQAYPIQLPLEWKLLDADTFPHFIGELTAMFMLPAGRPMPDNNESIIPAEHPDFRMHAGVPTSLFPVPDEPVTPPTEPPVEPKPDEFIAFFRAQDVNVPQNKFTLTAHGLSDDDAIRFAIGSPGNALPAPIVADRYYYVVNAQTNQFQVAFVVGGTPVTITNSGVGTDNQIWRKQL
jgi:hypothetical protein